MPTIALISNHSVQRPNSRPRSARQTMAVAACLLVWIVLFGMMSVHLPLRPGTMGDTQDYLTLASQRPPLYGWILAAYRWGTGGLRFLPLFQFSLMGLALLLLAVELGLLVDRLLAGPAAILLILLHPAIHDAPRMIMTEALYLAFVMAGLGLLLRATRRGTTLSLAGAAILFALAAITRTTGTAFLLLVPLVAIFDRRLSWRPAATRLGMSVGAIALVVLTGMTGNWLRHDRFEIGSFSGVAFLGKALLLIEPSDLSAIPAPARAAATATLAPAARGRTIIAHAPDLAAALRAQMQISEDLRFAIFFPAAMANWPAFASADWRERAVLGMGVARPLILAHPWGYARLWSRDLEQLVLYPNFWPAWATGEAAPRSQFPACRLQANCYSLDRYDLQIPVLVCLALVSLLGLAAALLLVAICAVPVFRRRADPLTALLFWCAMVLLASLVLSSGAEAGFPRYTVATHVLEVALLLGLVSHPRGARVASARLPLALR